MSLQALMVFEDFNKMFFRISINCQSQFQLTSSVKSSRTEFSLPPTLPHPQYFCYLVVDFFALALVITIVLYCIQFSFSIKFDLDVVLEKGMDIFLNDVHNVVLVEDLDVSLTLFLILSLILTLMLTIFPLLLTLMLTQIFTLMQTWK